MKIRFINALILTMEENRPLFMVKSMLKVIE